MAEATCSAWQGDESGTTWPAGWGASGRYKIISDRTFVSGGKTYVAGRISDPIDQNWCATGTITVASGVPTFSSFTLPQTDVGITNLNGSGEPTYALIIYSNAGRVKRNILFQNWRIGESLTTTFNFAALASYNDAVTVVNPRPRFLDEDEVNNLITARLNAPATTTQLGIVEMDVPPVDVTRPIAVGANSYASTIHLGIGKPSVAPASASLPIWVGDNDTRVPTQPENDALQGTNGSPSNTNRYVTSSDPRLVNVVDVVQAGTVFRDAVVSTDGVISGGSLSTFSSVSHPCVTADVSKKIVVYGAGSLSGLSGLNNALRTSVSAKSGNNYTLSLAATAAVSGARWVYGTDNTTAVQALATAMSSTGGVLFFPPGKYMLGAVTLPSNVTVWAMPGTVTIYSIANSVFTFSNQSSVTIDGLGIDACGNALGNGAVTLTGGTGVSDIRVQRCRFVDTFLTGNVAPVSTFNRHGVLVRDSTDVWILDNFFEHALRIKAAGGTVGEQRTYIIGNTLRDTNENGISLLTGQAVTVRDIFILNNIIDGIMATGNGIVIGDDGGGGVTQTFINITVDGNIFKGLLPANTAYIQDKGTGVAKNISISHNKFDNSTGTNQSTTFAINKANQGTTSQTVNFQAVGNEAVGYYDQAVFRLGNIASGVVADNLIDAATNTQRGIRLGTVSNLKVHHNVIAGCSYGVYFNAGTLSNLEVGHNIITLPASNNVVGFYIESTVTPPTITLRRNTVLGAGGSFTNVYGFEDASAGVGGVTVGVSYVENSITNLTTTTGLGSFKYRTLLSNAVVTEPPAATTPQLLGGTGINNSATPDVRGSAVLSEAYTSPVTVTAINNASPGVPFTILFTTSNVTLQNNSAIKLAGGVNFSATANDSITFVWNGSACVESARSVN